MPSSARASLRRLYSSSGEIKTQTKKYERRIMYQTYQNLSDCTSRLVFRYSYKEPPVANTLSVSLVCLRQEQERKHRETDQKEVLFVQTSIKQCINARLNVTSNHFCKSHLATEVVELRFEGKPCKWVTFPQQMNHNCT